jgi:hypothetical protein
MLTIVAVSRPTPDNTTRAQVMAFTGEIGGGLVVWCMAILEKSGIDSDGFPTAAGCHVGRDA